MEEDLIRRAQTSDQMAFRSLVEQYLPVAWRICRILLTDRSIAEDALQEAWIDVWRALPGVDATRPLRPWLLTVVANRCRMTARRRRIRTVTLDEELAGHLRSVDSIAHELELHEVSEAEALRHTALLKALATLAPEQRQLLALRYQADLNLGEIAAVLGIPTGTVKSRLHRTLAALRTHLLPMLALQATDSSSTEARP